MALLGGWTGARADPVAIDTIKDYAFTWPGTRLFYNSTLSLANRQVLRNGQPFLVRGVTYSPSPINSYGPFAEDLFRPGMELTWQRDLPLMAHAGINSIRV